MNKDVSGLVLGVNLGLHDASAALVRDNRLLRLVEQERLSRSKHAIGQSPATAIRECLAVEGVSVSELDAVAIGWDFRRLGGDSPRPSMLRRTSRDGVRRILFPEIRPEDMPPVVWVPHHVAHAASAYYTCGADIFGEDVAIIVVDGGGELECSTIARGHAGAIDILQQWPMSQSLGFFYSQASMWAGLGLWGAGKLMGLAAYGRPEPMPIGEDADGYHIGVTAGVSGASRSTAVPGLRFSPEYASAVRELFGTYFPFAEREGESAAAYADFAASVQQSVESAVLGLAKRLRGSVGGSTLVLAGGVAMNCSMVGRLLRERIFDRVYVPPVPTDAGVSLGAALYVAHQAARRPGHLIDHAYWSTEIDSDDAASAARSAGLVVTELPESQVAACAAGRLAAGQILGWAQGRGEIGQRALGARSLLADPRDRRSHERLNLIKGREMWRPVAPSILSEDLDDVLCTPVGDPARFMLAAGIVRPDVRRTFPAITHVDGTARPQAVERATNPRYWALIDSFKRTTGSPAVVNTSLNLAGEPIVCTADDCVKTFVQADGVDALVVNNLLIVRSESHLAEPS